MLSFSYYKEMSVNISHTEIDRRIDSQAEELARLMHEAEAKAAAAREAMKPKWKKLLERLTGSRSGRHTTLNNKQ